MYNEQRMINFKIIIGIYFLLLTSYSLGKLKKIIPRMNASSAPLSTGAQNNTKKSNSRKKRDKTKHNEIAPEESNKASTSQEKKVSKVKNLTEDVFPIVCQWRCNNVFNIGYISINCSEKCYNQYHAQCWQSYKDLHNIHNEETLLSLSCLTTSCCGKIYEIVWVEKFRVGNRKRVKTKKPLKITRSVSETSQSSLDDKQSPKIQNKAENQKINGKIAPLNSKEEKSKSTYKPIAIIKPTKTYASTVRNTPTINDSQHPSYNVEDSLHDSKLVEELLGQNCPESFDPSCKLPQRSKMLTLIRENSNSDYSFEGSVGEIGSNKEKEMVKGGLSGKSLPSGFIIDTSNPSIERKPSNCLIFVPGTNQ